MSNYIRFDWAIKKMLRNKSNYGVLEGFMESLLGRKFRINRFLESESNQLDENDKFCRVDILAEDEEGALYIFEVQNNHEISYFHRMLYGASKTIVEYINMGDDYGRVKKVYSINIIYFTLGQGKDYVYHGYTTFRGLNDTEDILQLTAKQRTRFLGLKMDESADSEEMCDAGVLFPEYYVLRINDYDTECRNFLDEWISFLKTGNIEPRFQAPGMDQARACLDYDRLPQEDRRAYDRHRENERYKRSVTSTYREEGYDEGFGEGYGSGYGEGYGEGYDEGIRDFRLSTACKLIEMGQDDELISKATGLSKEVVKALREKEEK